MQNEKVSVLKKEKKGLEDQHTNVSTKLREANRDLAEVDAKYSQLITKHSKLQTTVDDLKKELQEERNHSAALMKNIEAQEEIVTKAHSTAISLLARDVSSDFPDDEIKKQIRNFLQNSLFGWCADNSARRVADPETAGPFLKQRGLLLRNNDDLPEHLQFDIQHNMAPVVLLQAALAHELVSKMLLDPFFLASELETIDWRIKTCKVLEKMFPPTRRGIFSRMAFQFVQTYGFLLRPFPGDSENASELVDVFQTFGQLALRLSKLRTNITVQGLDDPAHTLAYFHAMQGDMEAHSSIYLLPGEKRLDERPVCVVVWPRIVSEPIEWQGGTTAVAAGSKAKGSTIVWSNAVVTPTPWSKWLGLCFSWEGSDVEQLVEDSSVSGSRCTTVESNKVFYVALIAVMGVTGSGKSNFLRLVTGQDGRDGPQVGHSLESCTQMTRAFECLVGERQVVFYDTPGFDDTYRGDADILADIANALSSSYRSNVKLTGIIYLHRIKDERMTNAIMRNLTMFRNLCGDNAFKNVILVTTFWDELQDKTKGESRERDLLRKQDWWGYMAAKGSRTHRFLNTRESALGIVSELLDLPAVALHIQQEIIDQGLEIDQTKAGEALNQELAELRAAYQEQMESLREEKERAIRDHDEQMQEALESMEAEKHKFIRQLESEQAALQADRREERRKMEQAFNDQLRRLERERKARDGKVEELEARLSTERADSNRHFQDAMAESSRTLEELKADMALAREDDRSRFEQTIRLSRQIRENSVAMMVAGNAERQGLEARIAELEAQKESNSTNFWDILAPISSIAAAVVMRGIL
ncbi:hypothetical protein B0T24DRAFT_651556 [Lasiosphaeria ovina]|uniref:G domain-containing protein n=1 Tax=Lasiosphaeria ovina TaxID=92902 RepID=A0AAE0JZI5_9PEZI|nr:hypothetical protein B0T24DRAFT_651556 [Lasiosphaeria ovina]